MKTLQQTYVEKILSQGGKIVQPRTSKYIVLEHCFNAPNGETIKRFLFLGKRGSVRYNQFNSLTGSVSAPKWYLQLLGVQND